MHITVQYNNLFLSENAHFIHAKLIIQKMDVNELAHVPNACNDVQKVYCVPGKCLPFSQINSSIFANSLEPLEHTYYG